MFKSKITLPVAAAILAMMFAIAGNVLAKQSTVKTDNPRWHYNLTTTAGESNPANYTEITGSDPGDCTGLNSVYCIIDAPRSGSNPNQPDLAQFTVESYKFTE